MEERALRRYSIQLAGFDAYDFIAPNAGRAKADAYRAWCDAGYDDTARRRGERPFAYFLAQIEHCYAMGEEYGDPRTPEYGVAP
jgi:hypothetical protein